MKIKKIASYEKFIFENPFTPKNLQKVLESPFRGEGIFGIFNIEYQEGKGYLCRWKEGLHFIRIKKCKDEEFFWIFLHEILHLYYHCSSIGLREVEYWTLENLIETEVGRTLKNYKEEYSKIYNTLKTNQKFPKIYCLKNVNVQEIKKIVLENFELKKLKISHIEKDDLDESFFTGDF